MDPAPNRYGPKLSWFDYPPCAAAISVDPRSELSQAEIKLEAPALALTAKAHRLLVAGSTAREMAQP